MQEVIDKINTTLIDLNTEEGKAVSGNKSAAVRARKHASELMKLLKQFREEILPLTK